MNDNEPHPDGRHVFQDYGKLLFRYIANVLSLMALSSTAVKELDEHLTCSVCLDQYTNPKTLQCHHSFCLKCIEKLPQELQVGTHTDTHQLMT